MILYDIPGTLKCLSDLKIFYTQNIKILLVLLFPPEDFTDSISGYNLFH